MGVVVWRVIYLLTEWLAWHSYMPFKPSILHSHSTVLDLGHGVAEVIAITLAPKIGHSVATDQAYFFKLLRKNLEENIASGKETGQLTSKPKKNQLLALDWQSNAVSGLPILINADNRQGGGIQKVDFSLLVTVYTKKHSSMVSLRLASKFPKCSECGSCQTIS